MAHLAKYLPFSFPPLLPFSCGVFAGLQGPPPKSQLMQNILGSPCECKGGRPPNVPTEYTQSTDCGDSTAYLKRLPSPTGGTASQSWVCVNKPTILPSGSSTPPCPSTCTTFHASMHSSCYSSASQCTSNGRTYYTATLNQNKRAVSPGHIPTAVHNSPYLSASCQGEVGQSVCWNLTSPIHISDGGGPQDQARQQALDKRWDSLFGIKSIEYHPLVKPRPYGVGLDPQTNSILEATHRALNITNPTLAQDCWLCMSLGTSFPLAVPINNSSLSRPFPVQFSTPFNATCIASGRNDSSSIQIGFSEHPPCANITVVNSAQLCAPAGHVFVCGSQAYSVLPSNWTGICALAFLLPDIDIIPGDQPVPIPAIDSWPARTKRAVQVVPILVGLGISAAMGTGATGLGVSIEKYTKLAHQMIDDMEAVGQSLQEIQDQIDSLAEVVLQNRRGLDLLTVEKGGICLALQERCCFYTNKSGVVRDRLKKLQETLDKRRKELYDSPFWGAWNGFLPYLLPLLGPLLSLFLILSAGPCILRWIGSFINNRLESARHQIRTAAYAVLRDRDPEAYAMIARLTYDRIGDQQYAN